MNKCDQDFDVTIYNYLQDKFKNHKLSEYEEATAYLSYLMFVEWNKMYAREMRRGGKR